MEFPLREDISQGAEGVKKFRIFHKYDIYTRFNEVEKRRWGKSGGNYTFIRSTVLSGAN